ncbi:hypothetical protein FHR24_002142 [Wenyingzhuangia heitensis]|uniref:DUF4856 domain-containing protein n=1 Tax=Wenyingzhuangia heitensis TaxID=1487859 RepID=A0ABX0UA31_9FLAO|nr:DUF4856 domain-containing protein [Wenyingzhuangia heitensis]NIJ45674.1 hypothetical protein [Wenyingzhuangia heitensis]
MRITKLTLAVLVATGTLFTSCSSDDNNKIEDVLKFTKTLDDIDTSGLTIPTNYEFTRNQETTVNFSGQTTRLNQVVEIGALMTTVDPIPTQTDFTNRFNQATEFTDTSLNGSKNVRSKVAASVGLFSDNTSASDAIKADFDGYLTNQLTVLASKEEAAQGVAGIYDGKRFLNEKGLEYNQAFYKGLIGALAMDQTLNHYFNRLDDNFDGTNAYKTANDAGTLVSEANYTTMEHHFDEAYGYVYGAGDADKLLGHYLEEITGQSYFANIPEIVKNAFIIGRAAVVAKQYEARDAAIEVLRYQLSKIPAARGVYYLQKAKGSIDGEDSRAAFHALSEAYGFIYSLQFTYNPLTNEPYFTKAESEALVNKLYGSTNGFYDLTAEKLEELSEEIVAKYDFTIEQVNQ